MSTKVYLVKEALADKVKSFYAESKGDSPTPYIEFFASFPSFSVSLYEKKDKNGYQKLVLQGSKNAEIEGDMWASLGAIEDKKETKLCSTKPANKIKGGDRIHSQIGSDEVGTGDFFGPVCVVASYVPAEKIKTLEALGVTDSKKMDDDYIMAIVPTLLQDFEYSSLSLENEKYNEVHNEFNLNAIKAKMHNRCLNNLAKRYPEAKIYQDQFAEEKLYYSYLKDEKEILKGITFSTKGESKYPSVALASVFARYSFLTKMKKLDEKYSLHFPLGAGEKVTDFAIKFAKKFGLDELSKICKTNFKNYETVLAKLG